MPSAWAHAGAAGPLTGVPLAHKDIFVTRDWTSTAGSKMLSGYISPFDATVVEQFRNAGMVTLGKLNCDEFAMGSSNENSFFGPVKNPWDTTAVPGNQAWRSGSPGSYRKLPRRIGSHCRPGISGSRSAAARLASRSLRRAPCSAAATDDSAGPTQ